MLTEEDTARVPHLFHPAPRVAHREREMLGSIAVCELQRLFQIRGQYRAASVFERGGNDFCAVALLHLPSDFHLYVFDQHL